MHGLRQFGAQLKGCELLEEESGHLTSTRSASDTCVARCDGSF